ncbi:nucleotide pyrophosphohydrolase [Vibrio alginolyticus]|uniref:nucleotide pyrophosphohydrolase n=1 Tax=Vibrio alginolyticus TaxID=663 RepID=UPI00215E1780|nr:nucleotide pyrophosphohydrolase [Vibrio alginolyticus]MCS0187469.1 nucleotide pyrophosphohydrolase [Vibrio alginolyticus]
MGDIENLKNRIKKFTKERNWDQFHSPKNLSMALTVEASELLETLQWLTEEQSKTLTIKQKSKMEEEVADIFLYLLMFCEKTGIDLITASNNKIDSNGNKYPVEKSYGNSKKYTEL